MTAIKSTRTRWLSSLAALGSMGLLWLVILPWLGTQTAVREHVDALHAANINASAMFYSELECQYLLQR